MSMFIIPFLSVGFSVVVSPVTMDTTIYIATNAQTMRVSLHAIAQCLGVHSVIHKMQ